MTCEHLDAAAAGTQRILLSSYSPGSIVNSFIRNGERVSLRVKKDCVRSVSETCDRLGIDSYMPFASQVVYRRDDSEWANEFKVTYDVLTRSNHSSGWIIAPSVEEPTVLQ